MDGIGISVNGGSLTDTRRGTSIDSSLLAIDGTLEIHLNDQFEPDTIQGEFFIGDLVEELRGDGLPSEGPFTIAFGVDPQGEPYYEIR